MQLANILNGIETFQVTFVTLFRKEPSTIGFCGDQTNLFPLDQTVLVNFNPGQTCATVMVVVIVV